MLGSKILCEQQFTFEFGRNVNHYLPALNSSPQGLTGGLNSIN